MFSTIEGMKVSMALIPNKVQGCKCGLNFAEVTCSVGFAPF